MKRQGRLNEMLPYSTLERSCWGDYDHKVYYTSRVGRYHHFDPTKPNADDCLQSKRAMPFAVLCCVVEMSTHAQSRDVCTLNFFQKNYLLKQMSTVVNYFTVHFVFFFPSIILPVDAFMLQLLTTHERPPRGILCLWWRMASEVLLVPPFNVYTRALSHNNLSSNRSVDV